MENYNREIVDKLISELRDDIYNMSIKHYELELRSLKDNLENAARVNNITAKAFELSYQHIAAVQMKILREHNTLTKKIQRNGK